MDIIEILKAVFLGIVQGITEWLPVSSTGHMIIVDKFLQLNVSEQFMDMFLVVIQFGSILAVVVLYWRKLLPFSFDNGIHIEKDTIVMWLKIVVAVIPAAVVGILGEDTFNRLFYNYTSVSIMLILVGILFIVVENRHKNSIPTVTSIAGITYKIAFIIGLFQMVAAIFPGTSRSGATIIGALMLGVSRAVAAEFTFFLAVPVMFGASLLKLVRFGFHFTGEEFTILATGMIVAFLVSIFAIKFLMGYIKKHDFKIFGWYRIILGAIIIIFFVLF